MAITLAYYDTELITAVKRLYSTGPGKLKIFFETKFEKEDLEKWRVLNSGANIIKLITFVTYEWPK
jgi:hypothetical protein